MGFATLSGRDEPDDATTVNRSVKDHDVGVLLDNAMGLLEGPENGGR